MKIINFKLNIPKLIAIISCILAVGFIIWALVRFLNFSSNNDITMTNENYTNILKACHENIEQYIGKNIISTGYIFKAEDFNENEFVLARDMLINSSEAQIVGFMCNYKNAKDLEENSWVEIKGKIIKGVYHGELPIIEVKNIQKITTPENIFVYPPSV